MRKSESNLKSKLGTPSTVSGNAFRPVSGVKQPFNFVTQEVVEATCQCLLAQAEEAERNGQPEAEIEGLIIEEFGRCLSQIIEMANKQSWAFYHTDWLCFSPVYFVNYNYLS